MAKLRVGILISGRGSNMAALIAAARQADYPAEIVLVVSNEANAPGLAVARKQGVPTAVFLGPKPTRTIEPLPPVPSRVLRAMEHYVEGARLRDQKDEVVTAVTVETARQAVHDLLAAGSRGAAVS